MYFLNFGNTLKNKKIIYVIMNEYMRNWSTDTKNLRKNKDKFAVWKLEQLINFGLGKDKIKIDDLRKYWNILEIDPSKKEFLKFFM